MPSSRPPARLAGCVLVALAVLAAAGCSGDDDDAVSAPRATTVPPATDTAVTLETGETVVASAGDATALDEAIRAAVLDGAQRYVDAAIIAPLVTGQVGDAYEALFDATVRPSATGPDRPALTDEGVPRATREASVTATPVRIDGLTAADGAVALVAATFELDVTAASRTGPLTVRRSTELTFAPGPDGTWLVTAYRAAVQRDLPDAEPTTTTAAAG